MEIHYFDGQEDAFPTTSEVSWDELAEWFSTHDRAPCTPSTCKGKECEYKAQGGAWSPVTARLCPCPKCLGKRHHRLQTNVTAIHTAVFDLDHITSAQVDDLAELLEGHALIIYSTHNHLRHGPEDWCLRLVMPLSRPVSPAEWRRIHATLLACGLPIDPTCKDGFRLYFTPLAPTGAPACALSQTGKALDVEEILAAGAPASPTYTAPHTQVLEAEARGEVSVDMADIRKRLRTQRNELVTRVLAGEALAQAGGRDDALNQVCSSIAFTVPTSTPVEALLEVLRPSLKAMPPDSEGQHWGLEHWEDEARDMLERALSRRRRVDAQNLAVKQAAARQQKAWQEKQQRGDSSGPDSGLGGGSSGGAAGAGGPAGTVDDPHEGWEGALKLTEDGDIARVPVNAGTILKHHPAWRGTIRLNALTQEVELRGAPVTAPTGCLDTAVQDWLSLSEYSLHLRLSDVGAQVQSVAASNTYNPVAEYLAGLEWDGVSRIGGFLQEVCGTEAGETQSAEYLGLISRRWFISAAARALDPGCKVDTVLILEGAQGAKKSTVFNILAGAWFTDSNASLVDKDARMLAASNWVVELAELASLKRAESNSVKSFLSARVDKFRPPYGRRVETFPRRCVFVGSTNDEAYLNDATGARRYWTARVGTIDLKRAHEERDQLWAEAAFLYRSGTGCPECARAYERCADHRWWLDAQEQLLAAPASDARTETVVDAQKETWEARILTWWQTKGAQVRAAFGFADVAEGLQIATETIDRIARPVGQALKALGFSRRRKREGSRFRWIYEPNDELLCLPKLSLTPQLVPR